jgi:hypothetical protein
MRIPEPRPGDWVFIVLVVVVIIGMFVERT